MVGVTRGVAGREREYLRFFFDARTPDPSALDLDVFAAAYAQPGASSGCISAAPASL